MQSDAETMPDAVGEIFAVSVLLDFIPCCSIECVHLLAEPRLADARLVRFQHRIVYGSLFVCRFTDDESAGHVGYITVFGHDTEVDEQEISRLDHCIAGSAVRSAAFSPASTNGPNDTSVAPYSFTFCSRKSAISFSVLPDNGPFTRSASAFSVIYIASLSFSLSSSFFLLRHSLFFLLIDCNYELLIFYHIY